MSLRDYFAAKAMVALSSWMPRSSEDEFKKVATLSYSLADAMLKAREQ